MFWICYSQLSYSSHLLTPISSSPTSNSNDLSSIGQYQVLMSLFLIGPNRSVIVINKTTLFMLLEASPYNNEPCLATDFYLKVKGLWKIISRFFSNSTRLSLWLFWNILNVWHYARYWRDILSKFSIQGNWHTECLLAILSFSLLSLFPRRVQSVCLRSIGWINKWVI